MGIWRHPGFSHMRQAVDIKNISSPNHVCFKQWAWYNKISMPKNQPKHHCINMFVTFSQQPSMAVKWGEITYKCFCTVILPHLSKMVAATLSFSLAIRHPSREIWCGYNTARHRERPLPALGHLAKTRHRRPRGRTAPHLSTLGSDQ